MESMRSWLTPAGEEAVHRERRRLGHLRLQQVIDSLAFAREIPVRLLLPARLEALPNVVEQLCNDTDVVEVVKRALGLDEQSLASLKTLLAADRFETSAIAVFPQLSGERRTEKLNEHHRRWLLGMLAILPFVERKVWLTEMGNPLPAHALCRMQDQWALFTLLWTWTRRGDIAGCVGPISEVLGIPGLVVRVLPRQTYMHADQGERDLIPIVGPYFEVAIGEKDAHHHRGFCERFDAFAAAMRSLESEHDRSHITPLSDEVADALASQPSLDDQEAGARADQIGRAVRVFYEMEIVDGEVLESALPDEWKFIASACALIAQGEAATSQPSFDARTLSVDVTPTGRARVSRRIEGRPSRVLPSLKRLLTAIDERQGWFWASQTQAIQSLLNRHSPRSVEVGQDDGESDNAAVPHLLRGFGDRICRYLISMFRADGASIYWLDHAQDPSRLRLCGWSRRHESHQARKDQIISLFDERAWQPEPMVSEASKRQNSLSMSYRVAATGRDAPDYGALGDSTAPADAEILTFGTPSPIPRTAIATPLLINGRVVGVLELLGLVDRQFDGQVHRPMRRVATLLAASIYHELQIWQMRRLSALFRREAHRFVQERGVAAREGNLMRKIAQELANIFLCPFVALWLRDPASNNAYELLGLSRERLFPTSSSGGREMVWTSELGLDRSLTCFALDLPRVGSAHPGNECRGHFIHGRFDANVEVTIDYTLDHARRGIVLGRDFLQHGNKEAIAVRQRIFDPEHLGLREMMAFPLLSRDPNHGRIEAIGLLSLHDYGAADRPAWDRAWSTMVAHIQTYLPSLFEQAGLLHAPEHEARRYLLHAGRSLMIGLQDSFEQFHTDFGKVLAPGKGLRRLLDEAIDLRPGVETVAKLNTARDMASKAWRDFEMLQSDRWLNRMSELSNLMGEYRALGKLPGVTLSEANESCDLAQLLEEVAHPLRLRFGHRIPREFSVPSGIQLVLRVTWLRMALRDLVHNAAKYTSDSFDVAWDERQRLLTLSNDGAYDSSLDIVERLLSPRVQGSAGLTAKLTGTTTLDQRGQGLGLWGAGLLCRVMNIGFQMRIRPQESTLETTDSGIRRGRARYVVELNFSRHARVPLGAASRLL